MKTYQIISYDVWGNRKDGFEVNNAFSTGIIIELNDDASDKEIRRALFRSGFCSKGILTAKLAIDGEPEYSFYVNLIGSRYGLKPFCELRAV